MFVIPTTSDQTDFEQTTTLDGREYMLRFLYNEREDRWYVSISDQDDAPIAMGVKLVAHWPLLRRVIDPRKPPGMLIVQDLLAPDVLEGEKSTALDPGRNDLGTRCILLYWSAAELAAFEP